MGKLKLSGLAVWMACSAAFAQEGPSDFTTRVPLAVSGSGPWYRLELPLAVQLSARQADLSDVRVFNAAGEPQATQRDVATAALQGGVLDVDAVPEPIDLAEHRFAADAGHRDLAARVQPVDSIGLAQIGEVKPAIGRSERPLGEDVAFLHQLFLCPVG